MPAVHGHSCKPHHPSASVPSTMLTCFIGEELSYTVHMLAPSGKRSSFRQPSGHTMCAESVLSPETMQGYRICQLRSDRQMRSCTHDPRLPILVDFLPPVSLDSRPINRVWKVI